jgi:methyl-accepting chemotaxis protein
MRQAEGKSDLHAVLRDLERAIGATTSTVKSDLERARRVVHEAATRLDRSFRSLHSAAAAHRDALQSVAEALYGGNVANRSFAGPSEALLRQFVEEIVRVSRDSMRIIDQVSDLSSRVDSIVECADAIDGLARETRFIAFNARIETHRAGEAGRTFKVVADEVKRLANASSTLSNQIRQSVSECHVKLREVNATSTGLASHDMSRAIDSHKGLTDAVGKLDAVNRHLDEMVGELEKSVAEAARALQFEEIVSQILDTTVHRVERLGDFAVQALHVLDRGQNGDRTKPMIEILKGVRGLIEHAAVQAPAPERAAGSNGR